MKDSEVKDKESLAEKLSVAAVKYSFLKTGVKNDIAFDINESVNVQGDSGPYLLYIIARIKSILKKSKTQNPKHKIDNIENIHQTEKSLFLLLSNYPEVTALSAKELDPSKIAQYLFALAKSFNSFYHDCSVLQAEKEETKNFRIILIQSVLQVMEHGLYLLGIKTVEEM